MKSFYSFILGAWTFHWFGMSVTYIGKMPSVEMVPYDWTLSAVVLIMTVVPAGLGCLIGSSK
ncbi:MAG: hypothetical protein DRO67_00260 [Candidatus Asgardarchaeum californiense]|nr:MAG: hypothetical protein DRO67_00260 [Candidatus Asgardarchaeum californiense]